VPGTIIKVGKAQIVVVDHGKDSRGRRIRKWRSFATKREAEYYQAQAATHPALGAGAGVYGNHRLRVRDYLEQWLADYAKPRVKASTHLRYTQLIRTHLIPGLGHLVLSRVSPRAVETFYATLTEISSTTAHHVAALLRQALKRAVRWGLIDRNPTDLVDAPSRREWMPTLWTADQAAAFFAGAKGTRFELLYLTLAGTGLRLGEALKLTWQDIDFKSGVLTVQHGKTPKARRAVLLPAALLAPLRAVRGAGLVFHRDGKALDPRARTIRDHHFYPLIERLGLPKVRLHDLRHLHGSYLVSQGVDLASVAERLGHASKAFTLARYVHGMGQERAAEVSNQLLTHSAPAESANPRVH
jgi:integrase